MKRNRLDESAPIRSKFRHMNIKEWQKRLEDTFSFNDMVGGQLLDIFQCERTYGEYVAKTFYGQSTLIDSFQGFVIDTINESTHFVAKHGWPKNCAHYSSTIIYFVTMFRRIRACESLLLKGYPFDGYALLRDLKDRVIFLAAIAHNLTTWSALLGYGQDVPPPTSCGKKLTKAEQQLMKKNAENEERRLLNLIIRKKSGLDHQTRVELEKWEKMFNYEIHGAKLSFVTELYDWAIKGNPLSIGPTPKIEPLGMYMNRMCEVGWLVTRLLPYLQPVANAFGKEWQKKWEILDESFLYMQQGLGRTKKIGNAFITFVNQKFQFKNPFCYSEPDGTNN